MAGNALIKKAWKECSIDALRRLDDENFDFSKESDLKPHPVMSSSSYPFAVWKDVPNERIAEFLYLWKKLGGNPDQILDGWGDNKTGIANLIQGGLPLEKRKFIIQCFVEIGANIEATGPYPGQEFTPLMLAISRGDEEMVSHLVSLGADVKYKNLDGGGVWDSMSGCDTYDIDKLRRIGQILRDGGALPEQETNKDGTIFWALNSSWMTKRHSPMTVILENLPYTPVVDNILRAYRAQRMVADNPQEEACFRLVETTLLKNKVQDEKTVAKKSRQGM